MSDYDFQIKRGDRLPTIQASLTDGSGAAVNLTDATVKFLMRPRTSATPTVNAAAAIVGTATAGVVQYAWSAGDTDTAGEYLAEFEVTFLDGRKASFPSDGYTRVRVLPDVG